MLRDAVIGRVEQPQSRPVAGVLCLASQTVQHWCPAAVLSERWDVLHHEHPGLDALYRVEEYMHMVAARVVRVHRPGDGETLAWRTAEDRVHRAELLEVGETVAHVHVPARLDSAGEMRETGRQSTERLGVGVGGMSVSVDSDQRNPAGFGEAEVKTTCAAVQRHERSPHAADADAASGHGSSPCGFGCLVAARFDVPGDVAHSERFHSTYR